MMGWSSFIAWYVMWPPRHGLCSGGGNSGTLTPRVARAWVTALAVTPNGCSHMAPRLLAYKNAISQCSGRGEESPAAAAKPVAHPINWRAAGFDVASAQHSTGRSWGDDCHRA